ncbi:hypothetical protein Sinac_3440 [Singulisphaera acidiphila DSM 18658]|uniref:Uncharacterized protein n=1 Tax=Singulisphaera acidiphila (strain ATCC BAA-1392 / DSM 18658 / VKM B-2454 / MOB10) TaxID=886293 RepID=L0DG92_SINAD|nr:hypothetical protein Sinac_3440 [Singulisphaera acidiphila DSM 18658]
MELRLTFQKRFINTGKIDDEAWYVHYAETIPKQSRVSQHLSICRCIMH